MQTYSSFPLHGSYVQRTQWRPFKNFKKIKNFNIFDAGGASYPYSLQRTYQFREEMVTYRLNQIYYVSPYTARDFRYDVKLKVELDSKVETDTLRTLERQCFKFCSKFVSILFQFCFNFV